MKTKKALTLMATAVLLAGGLLSSPAAAGTGDDCPSGAACLYDYYNFDGLLGWRNPGMPRTAISSANNDKMASWINKMSTNGAWYKDVSGGPCFTMGANTVNSALSIFDRDTASSWKTTGGC